MQQWQTIKRNVIINVEHLKKRLLDLNKQSKVNNRYYTDYNSDKVKQLLFKFLDTQNISVNGTWSNKRDGWVIECPGVDVHEHNERRDDCTLNFVHKTNGFIFISMRCRHMSCGTALTETCKELNIEWGKFLNQHYE